MAFNLGSLFYIFKADTSDLEKANNRVEGSIKKTNKTVTKLAGALSVAFAGKIVKDVIVMSDQLNTLQRRFQTLTGNVEEGNAAFQKMAAIASATGQKLNDVASIFQRFLILQDEIGATTNELITFTDTLVKMGTIGGSSTAEINSVMVQLSQGLAAGVLRGEELNSVLEGMPLVAQAIAEELGVGVGALKEMGAEGKITSEDVLSAILNQSTEIADKFEEMPKSLGTQTNAALTAIKGVIQEVDKDIGATEFLSKLFGATAEAAERARLRLVDDDELQDLDEARRRVAEIEDEIADWKLSLEELERVQDELGEGESAAFMEEDIKLARDMIDSLTSRDLDLAIQLVNKLEEAEKAHNKALEDREKATRVAANQQRIENGLLDHRQKLLEDVETGTLNFVELTKALEDEQQDLSDVLLENAINQAIFTSATQDAGMSIEDEMKALKVTEEQLDRYSEATAKAQKEAKAYVNTLTRLESQLDPVAQATSDVKEETQELLDLISDLAQEYGSAVAGILSSLERSMGQFGDILEKNRQEEVDAFKKTQEEELDAFEDSINEREDLTDEQKRNAIEAAREASEAAIEAKEKQTKEEADAEKALFIVERGLAVARILVNGLVAASRVGFLTPLGIAELAAAGIAATAAAAVGVAEYKSTFGTETNAQANTGSVRSAAEAANQDSGVNIVVENNAPTEISATRSANGTLVMTVDQVADIATNAVASDISSNNGAVSSAINSSTRTSRRL